MVGRVWSMVEAGGWWMAILRHPVPSWTALTRLPKVVPMALAIHKFDIALTSLSSMSANDDMEREVMTRRAPLMKMRPKYA